VQSFTAEQVSVQVENGAGTEYGVRYGVAKTHISEYNEQIIRPKPFSNDYSGPKPDADAEGGSSEEDARNDPQRRPPSVRIDVVRGWPFEDNLQGNDHVVEILLLDDRHGQRESGEEAYL
jgi:hypothetical protein